jgi:hypothetical protein
VLRGGEVRFVENEGTLGNVEKIGFWVWLEDGKACLRFCYEDMIMQMLNTFLCTPKLIGSHIFLAVRFLFLYHRALTMVFVCCITRSRSPDNILTSYSFLI